ncbi:hypothetical protein [Thiomicrorhabdus sp. Milos-T2]|uniref:hypothetical protein n=1 Tax=Thiomicrorhabdus sp. Milos-T2 TaxID=90814 RepID=UPI000A51155F|nr:hypothetical protein [Thiomicrorhabdus sp. Milos-T2]
MTKILILDDAKVIRALLKLTLESDGITCNDAETVIMDRNWSKPSNIKGKT